MKPFALSTIRQGAAALTVALATAAMAAPAFASGCTSTSTAPNQSPYGVKVLPWCEQRDQGPSSNDGAVWMHEEHPQQTGTAQGQNAPVARNYGGPNANPGHLPWNRDLDEPSSGSSGSPANHAVTEGSGYGGAGTGNVYTQGSGANRTDDR